MPLKLVDATVSSFDIVFEKFRSEAPKNKANLILFLADKDPSTNLSWCPGLSMIISNLSFSLHFDFWLFVLFPFKNVTNCVYVMLFEESYKVC